jgi:hypothetical protein
VIGRSGVVDADIGTRTTHNANAAAAIRNSPWPNAERRMVPFSSYTFQRR